jgi:hypothetical protein
VLPDITADVISMGADIISRVLMSSFFFGDLASFD